MSPTYSISSCNNLVFICEKNEQITVPEQFPQFSRFLREYLCTYMGENEEEESKGEASRIQLGQIEMKHVKIIFDFLKQWKKKMPSEYNGVLLDEEHIKQITVIPTWSQAFFQMVGKDDLIASANAANFLAVPIFIKYFTNFFVKRLEICESSSEITDLMNLENDFTRNEKETHEKFLKNSSWKELVMDTSPEKESNFSFNFKSTNEY